VGRGEAHTRNGTDTVGLHRESTGFVYDRNTHTQGNADTTLVFGQPPWLPVAGTFE
jgi:hypothetical protein